MMSQSVCPPQGPLQHRISPPGSKSLTNRALLLAAMATGPSQLRGCLVSEDTELMRQALIDLGVGLEDLDPQHPWVNCGVQGQGKDLGRAGSQGSKTLQVGTAGTVARFLTAALAGSGAPVALDGSPRMRERPMGQLLQALRELGASVECSGVPDALPLRLAGRQTPIEGGKVTLEKPASSQFISALMFSGLMASAPTEILLTQGCPALPYVNMTMEALKSFGGEAKWLDAATLKIWPSTLKGCQLDIEPDASAASYFLALATIYGGRIEIPSLGDQSLQGDAKFHEVLAKMGAKTRQDHQQTEATGTGTLRGADLDLTDMPDMTLTAAVVALHCKSPTTIRGVEILRHHECDRLAAGAAQLRKLGAQVTEHEDGLTIVPPGVDGNPCAAIKRDVSIETYLDHRMAMAFALAGHVKILDPACTDKTYPGYFAQLDELGMCPAGVEPR